MAVLNPPPCWRCGVGSFAAGVLRSQPPAAGADDTGIIAYKISLQGQQAGIAEFKR
uniref:Uncharacterized protein n=1 Tax=Hyaloperonospora arabidopsidis (strain Emoy2) TaxID=559515 RepID=M4C377_HYAAE